MNRLRKLPGSVRAAPGLEHAIWRRIPHMMLAATIGPLLAAWGFRWLAAGGLISATAARVQLLEYTMYGVIVLLWTMILTLALGCFIVRLMKGPGYVSDPYALPEERPEARPGRHSRSAKDR